jgi:hypothetical protein
MRDQPDAADGRSLDPSRLASATVEPNHFSYTNRLLGHRTDGSSPSKIRAWIANEFICRDARGSHPDVSPDVGAIVFSNNGKV